MTEKTDVAANIEKVKERIRAACERCGRNPEEITLVAVTKTYPVDMMNEAIAAGITDIGENKPQEIRDKYPYVAEVNWHQIGHLQTNKVKYVIDKVKLIQSVDSVKLLDEIERQAIKHDRCIDVLIQVNISGEESKSGVHPSGLNEILEYAGNLTHVKVVGLMTIAQKKEENLDIMNQFQKMNKIYIDIQRKKYDNVIMKILSMGMSGDFEEAIEAGSNMIRVGTAIFGKREYK